MGLAVSIGLRGGHSDVVLMYQLMPVLRGCSAGMGRTDEASDVDATRIEVPVSLRMVSYLRVRVSL